MPLPGFLPASIMSLSVLYLVAVAITNGMLGQRADRGEIFGHVERQVGIGRGHHDVRGGMHQHGVAVRIGLRDLRHAERGAGAAAVLDHEGLADLLADLLEHGAGGDVGCAAGGERHDDLDRLLGRPLLRPPRRTVRPSTAASPRTIPT